MSQGSRMPDYQIPEIFHRFQGWMEVREQVMKGLSKGLWKTSTVPSTLHSEELNSGATSELSASKRKPEEQFQKSKKTLTKSQESEDDENEELYAELEYLENLLSGETGQRKLAEQKHFTKQRIFNEFFTKWRNSHSKLLEERKNKTGENINDRLNIILNVLKENKEPALEEWMKACEENDVGQIGGSASRNYCIFNKDNYVHEMRAMRKKSSGKVLPQTSTSFQQDDSFYYFPDILYPGRNKEDALDWSDISPVLEPHEEADCHPDSGMILDSGLIPDSGSVPDSEVVPKSGSVSDSGVVPDSGFSVSSKSLGDHSVPDRNAEKDSNKPSTIIEQVLYSYSSYPFSDPVVPDRNLGRDSEILSTSTHPAEISFLRERFGDLFISDRKEDRDSENLSKSAESAESCLIENDEYSIDFDLLSKCELEKKSATETVAQGNDEDKRKYTASRSSVKPVRKNTEIYYTFAGQIQKGDVVESEFLQPIDEPLIFSNSEDETDEEQHLSDTEAVESGTETESTDSDSAGADVNTESMNECNVNTETTEPYISPLNIIITDPSKKQIFIEPHTILNTQLDERSVAPVSSKSESPRRSNIVSECY